MLGVYYGSGHADSDGQPDQKKAFKYFQKAAIKGMPEAQYNVGLRFLHGNGTEQNHFNAAEFFRMASMQNFQLAQINLATMYVEGRGVKKNLDEARQLFEKVAGKGGPIGKDAQKRIQEIDQAQGINQGGSKCVIM
jgi:TPR repeat protein